MRNPKEPPPLEPFLLRRTPPTGTLLGVQSPRLPLSPAPAANRALPPAQAPGADLERHIEGLRVELASFREWLPAQLSRPMPRPSAAAPPSPLPSPSLAGRRRELQRQAATAGAGALVAVALAFASAAAALGWPAYGRLVASAARLDAPSAWRTTR